MIIGCKQSNSDCENYSLLQALYIDRIDTGKLSVLSDGQIWRSCHRYNIIIDDVIFTHFNASKRTKNIPEI